MKGENGKENDSSPHDLSNTEMSGYDFSLGTEQ
jgi:hypothetical protein